MSRRSSDLPRSGASWCAATAILLSFGLACGGGGGGSAPLPSPPVIQSFSASPASIEPGQSSTLSWVVAGASTLAIAPGLGTVSGSSIGTGPLASTTTYTLTATNAGGSVQQSTTVSVGAAQTVRIAYLHHSTGGVVWDGGVPDLVEAYNAAHGTHYVITQLDYPACEQGYPWDNYPFDYWNLWVRCAGSTRDHGEMNLDDLVAQYDVICFKHCFPVSDVEPADGNPSLSSPARTIANYQLQYEALKVRLHQFPSRKFLLWTGAARRRSETDPETAARAKQFFDWVKATWNTSGDNIQLWDFRALETAGVAGDLYLNDAYAAPGDSHPSNAFGRMVAPWFVQRLVDVIEGRGDSGSITGH